MNRGSEEYWQKVKDRASHPMSAEPRPFLRWAGSKRSLTGQLVTALPEQFRAYHEPFLGGGALFLLLQPKVAYLNDTCTDLIGAWRAIKRNATAVARIAESFALDEDSYYAVRRDRSSEMISRAGEMLYLNRACFNGLYRVNSRGEFNVPWGGPKGEFVVDRPNLKAVQKLLRQPKVKLTSFDFEVALKSCKSGDLVFLDPPYVTSHNNNGFVDYNKRLFSWQDQIRLATAAERLRKKGCHVVVTNALHDDVIALYPKFKVEILGRYSTLAGDKTRRVPVKEALLIGRLGENG